MEFEKKCGKVFSKLDDISFENQKKVLKAFSDCNITTNCFAGTTGYGYGDLGREKLSCLFAKVFETEDAIISPSFTCGSHAISCALFGLLRPNDVLLSITGKPYDTLNISIFGNKNNDIGSLKDFGVVYKEVDIVTGDKEKIFDEIKIIKPKVIFLQRSRGYKWISELSVKDILEITEKIKKISPSSFIFLDNCYGEFTDYVEPTKFIDVCAGSLIKNPGGGIAQTGGYICGTKKAIDLISGRFTSPSLLTEVGSFEQGYRNFFQGLFLAPHVTIGAAKGIYLISEILQSKGFDVLSSSGEIILSVKFKNEEQLVKFIQLVQKYSPIDSNAVPFPWDMPGYLDKVIMAAGTFVSGASIELSADAPIRPPYIGYLQGGITYEHCKIFAEVILEKF